VWEQGEPVRRIVKVGFKRAWLAESCRSGSSIRCSSNSFACRSASSARAAETLLGICADHFWEDFPKDAAYQPVRCQSPHFTGAQAHIDKIPLTVDRKESVSDTFKDFLGYADESEFFCCSSAFIT
jgi:hypothetical protein